MRYFLLFLLGCSTSHSTQAAIDVSIDASLASDASLADAPTDQDRFPSDMSSADAAPCPSGWHFDGLACARWRTIEGPPCAYNSNIFGRNETWEARGDIASDRTYFVCDERAFWYDESLSAWREEAAPMLAGEIGDVAQSLPELEHCPVDGTWRVSTELEPNHVLSVRWFGCYSGIWLADLWDPSTGWSETLDPPRDSWPISAWSLGPRRGLFVGARGRAAIYERQP